MDNANLKKIIRLILNSHPPLRSDTVTCEKIATELFELIFQRDQENAINRELKKRRDDLKMAAQILRKGPADRWSSVISVMAS